MRLREGLKIDELGHFRVKGYGRGHRGLLALIVDLPCELVLFSPLSLFFIFHSLLALSLSLYLSLPLSSSRENWFLCPSLSLFPVFSLSFYAALSLSLLSTLS